MPNQTPEQIARDKIDAMLRASGWKVQNRKAIDWSAGIGIAVREYPTDIGPADYVLFVDRKPLGVIEAKPETEGYRLTVHESQAEAYAQAQLKYVNNDVLAFVYESTGEITRFTNFRDPKPRARQVFSFHRPKTFKEWMTHEKSLRSRILELPILEKQGLRDCQTSALENLDKSFKDNFPRALIQMATGSGKTYTAITFIYRLLKFANAKRVLFLVDTKNLGEQAEQEFMAYTPSDDNRKFTELYNVQRLKSSYVSKDSQVCICTIQRLYSILKGEELDEKAEETNPNEMFQPKEPMPVVYNEKVPVEFFDFIVIDECHRSIYNLWRQVLEYFDSFLIGLTATPDKRTFGFFNENIVSEYSHERAVADGVNVGYDVYTIETEITSQGARIETKEYIDVREKLTRRKRWEQLDEEVTYTGKQLDKDVVNPSQIRNIIKAFKNKLSEIFPGRSEIPKTLIFAKTDSHADDIIEIVREEFAEGNDFCKKITYLFVSLLIVLVIGACGATAQIIQPSGKTIGSDKQGNTIYQIPANGIEIGYKLIGAGEPLVMIMGLGGTMDNWPQEVIEALSKKYQLILLDNRGMGHTTANDVTFTYRLFADDVMGLLDALGVKKTNVLGYSMGSVITQELLLEYPQRFNKAIIHATSTDGSSVAKAIEGKTYDDKTVARQIEVTTHWKTPIDKLPLITNQVMLVVGTSDATVGVESSKTIASAIPGAWLVQFKNATHLLIYEAPTEFAKVVLNFLDINETVTVNSKR